jgi:Rrf2 family protein
MISKSAVHALRAASILAMLEDGEYSESGSLARRIDAPPNYLSKLLQTLARAGVVLSRKGPRGGFRLARDPGEIRLIDVVEPIDQVSRWDGCFLGLPICSDSSPCAVHERWDRVRREYFDLLADTTIGDVIARLRETGLGEPGDIDMAANHLRGIEDPPGSTEP